MSLVVRKKYRWLVAVQHAKPVGGPPVGKQKKVAMLNRQLWGKPWLPLLFISEHVKQSAFLTIGEASAESVGITGALSALSLILWIYFHEEIQWGVNTVTEGEL